ncbi:MAG TPA: hypothetical protein VNR65_16230 [Geobacterales bacterium]|nr:hypothetical protein [Geobacterales bacterium]
MKGETEGAGRLVPYAIKSGRRQSATRTRIPPIEFDLGAAAPDVGDKMERSGRGPAALYFCDSVRDPTDGVELPFRIADVQASTWQDPLESSPTQWNQIRFIRLDKFLDRLLWADGSTQATPYHLVIVGLAVITLASYRESWTRGPCSIDEKNPAAPRRGEVWECDARLQTRR